MNATDPVLTNELPAWLPYTNLAVSVFAGIVWFPLFIRRARQARRRGDHVWLAMDVACGILIVVIIGGALFQSNLLKLWDWTVIGTGGRFAAAVVLLIMLTIRSDQQQ
jgi:hypothetical protein